MKTLISAIALFFGLAMTGLEAEAAKRLGGGKNMGSQRSMTQQPKPPAQQQQAQQQQQAGAAQQPAAAAPQGNKWLGPLAGLALGAGLMALFMNNGIAGALAGLLLAAAIAAVLVFAFRALRGRNAQQAPLQYAGHQGQAPQPDVRPAFGGGAAVNSVAATAGRWPADFNAQEFLRHARLNFVRLQEANDKRDHNALADFLSADLLAEVQAQWQSEGPAQGKTDVVTLESEVLEVVSEGLLYVASVRFSGLIREDGAAEAQPFAEIWHLEKAMRGNTGWLVSGIQQA
ncbi:MAG: 39S ribosomal protein L45 [Burkholderiales bacterium]|nr:39S ribosomal protein L45 [Burkholderiales bacterium]